MKRGRCMIRMHIFSFGYLDLYLSVSLFVCSVWLVICLFVSLVIYLSIIYLYIYLVFICLALSISACLFDVYLSTFLFFYFLYIFSGSFLFPEIILSFLVLPSFLFLPCLFLICFCVFSQFSPFLLPFYLYFFFFPL